MAGLPVVDKYLGILRFAAKRPRQATVILMSMSKDYAANISDTSACLSQSRPQRIDRFGCLRASVDDRHRIFFDQIDVDRADVERRWQRNGDDFHCRFSIANCRL